MTTFTAEPVLFASGRVETATAAAALAASVARQVEELGQQLADGDIEETEFTDAVRALLESAGAQAGLSDDAIAALLDGRDDYLDSYAGDIAGGLSLAAIASRAALWGGLAVTAYHMAQAQGRPAGTLVTWTCEADGASCDDCRELAAGSPYTLDELPTFPGDAVACLGNCRCELSYDEGGDDAEE